MHRSPVDSSLRRGAAAVAVTGGAFSLVAAVSPAPATGPAAAPVAQTAADGVVLPTSVEPVDPDPEVLDASDLVKAVQLAEEATARITAERTAEQERAAEQVRAAEQERAAREQVEERERVEAAADCDLDTSELGRVKSHVRAAAEFLGCRFGEPDMHGVAGRAGTSDHPSGLAVDFMVGRRTGDALAACALQNMDALGVKYVIWEQRINHGDGWSAMEDRGGETANHFDHVHISFDATRGSSDLNAC